MSILIVIIKQYCLILRTRGVLKPHSINVGDVNKILLNAGMLKLMWEDTVLTNKAFNQRVMKLNKILRVDYRRWLWAKMKNAFISSPTCPEMNRKIVHELFLYQNLGFCVLEPMSIVIPCKIEPSKKPGPNDIPNIAFKRSMQLYTELFIDVYHSCFSEGVFPDFWKRQKLVLFPKG